MLGDLFLENRAISQSFLSPSKNRSAWRFGINNWDDHQLSLNPNRKPRVQHCHIWGPVWSVFLWAIFHMAFSGISRGRPTYTSNHLGDVFVVQELNRAPGKRSMGISPAKMGGWSLKKPRGARNTWNMYNEKMVTRSISPVPHLFVQPYLGWGTNTFGMGWKQQPGRKSGHFEFFRTFLDQRIWSLIVECSQDPLWEKQFQKPTKHSYIVLKIVWNCWKIVWKLFFFYKTILWKLFEHCFLSKRYFKTILWKLF